MYGMHPYFIYRIHTSYHVYLYILHIYPNFIAFRLILVARHPSSSAKFWVLPSRFLIDPLIPAGLEDVQFSAKKNFWQHGNYGNERWV